MPYQKTNNLPDAVKDHLPKHAQEIFLAAFNSAEEQYSDEERAFRVGWSAVKRDYEKGDDGNWHRKRMIKLFHQSCQRNPQPKLKNLGTPM